MAEAGLRTATPKRIDKGSTGVTTFLSKKLLARGSIYTRETALESAPAPSLEKCGSEKLSPNVNPELARKDALSRTRQSLASIQANKARISLRGLGRNAHHALNLPTAEN